VEFPNKKYQIIYADPPWTYPDNGSTTNSRGKGQQYYDIMTLDEIKALPIQQISDDNCYLFMWATGRRMKDCIAVLEAWGFEFYNIVFTWIKKNKKSNSLFWGMGNVTRMNAEYVLLGKKGKLQRLNADVHSVIEAPIGKHSEKPTETRNRIIRLYGDIPRIELFARTKTIGWDVWGNDPKLELKPLEVFSD
jgi:N6-adenosine-specific RNA methylase IME4